MIEDTLREVAKADEQTKDRIIRELANNPDETLAPLMNILQVGPKGLDRIAVRVIRAIGYPRNKSAMPQLIYLIGDLNSPAWTESAQTLLEMGTESVVPVLIHVLLDRGKNIPYWRDTTEGICAMISGTDVNRDYASGCGPTIAFLLAQENLALEIDLDSSYLLDALKKIGEESAMYALPSLISLVQREGTSELGKETQALIASFDATSLKPYKYLLDFLQDTDV